MSLARLFVPSYLFLNGIPSTGAGNTVAVDKGVIMEEGKTPEVA